LIQGVPGIPFPGGWLEKAARKPTPNRPQVVRIAVKSLIQGVLGIPSPGGWLEKAAPKPIIPNRPQALHIAVKSLIQGVPGIPSPGGWLEKAARKPISNRPQVLRIAGNVHSRRFTRTASQEAVAWEPPAGARGGPPGSQIFCPDGVGRRVLLPIRLRKDVLEPSGPSCGGPGGLQNVLPEAHWQEDPPADAVWAENLAPRRAATGTGRRLPSDSLLRGCPRESSRVDVASYTQSNR
jgi:hypothetical protein